MFTGLVQLVGVLETVREQAEGRELVIASALAEADRALGASVAINGVCLTVTASGAARTHFEAAFETLHKTTLGQLQSGARVNLEPALRVGDPLGGHLVSGHVDGVAVLRSVEPRGAARELWIEAPTELARFIAPKGSVTIEGVSLTVNAVDDTRFMLGIIPHTLEHTTLGSLRVGARLNLEVDILARYVARLLERGGAGDSNHVPAQLTVADLMAAGFDKDSR